MFARCVWVCLCVLMYVCIYNIYIYIYIYIYIFSFIRHLGSNTIITIKEIKVLVYEIISNSITK